MTRLHFSVSRLPGFVLTIVAFSVGASCLAWAAEVPATNKVAADYLPGLVATYRFDDRSYERIDKQIALDATTADRASVRGEAMSAQWQGLLQIKGKTEVRLHLFTEGAVEVELAGEPILQSPAADAPRWVVSEPIPLGFGRHPLAVQFHTTQPAQARCALFWSGTGFQLEPVPPQLLWHTGDQTPNQQYAEGRALVRGLRCSACHEFPQAQAPLAAPALTHLQDNLNPTWLTAHLVQRGDVEGTNLAQRRMPYFGLDIRSAAAIEAALFQASAAAEKLVDLQAELAQRKKKQGDAKQPEVAGAELFASVGCLACHAVDGLAKPETLAGKLFSGGDLGAVSAKRSAHFLQRWLEDPSSVNADHRMPRMELSLQERVHLQAYLETLGAEPPQAAGSEQGDADLGRGLLERHRCGACHRLPADLRVEPVQKTVLTANSDWEAGCLQAAQPQEGIPGFGLRASQRAAIRATVLGAPEVFAAGEQVLMENNCLGCHQRDLNRGIAQSLPDVVDAHPDLAPRLAALSPPALTGVGDKLHRKALAAAIERRGAPLRGWLDVRMPAYRLEASELQSLMDTLISQDRIPDHDWQPAEIPGDEAARVAAARLVTSSGFGCQSCHAIGDMPTPQVDLKARGTNLAMLGDRIRQSWFERWVHNPSRIVPRMEMPAIQTAATGVLGGDLDVQLAALWRTLNTPDFRPPRPGAVRVVRSQNMPNVAEAAHVVTNVLETSSRTLIRPLLIGLPNRHNVLFDLEQGGLAGWWLGDSAGQYTRGKTWYWEPGYPELEHQILQSLEVRGRDGQVWKPAQAGQLTWAFDGLEHLAGGVRWYGRAHLENGSSQRELPLAFTVIGFAGTHQVHLSAEVSLPEGEQIHLITTGRIAASQPEASEISLRFPRAKHRISSDTSQLAVDEQGQVWLESNRDGKVRWHTEVTTDLPPETFPAAPVQWPPFRPLELDSVPGFEAVQLPLPKQEMPISLAWSQDGQLYMGSLKGRVFRVHDDDGDGLHDRYEPISDEYPTPYGIQAVEDGVDVLTKFALLRMRPGAQPEARWDVRVVADGWGYTQDYHDWAVGLERDAAGNYYMALPCQQDERSPAAAHLRGQALRLVPADRSLESSRTGRSYRIDPLAAGLRFPMGIVLTRAGDLFTTDNQGNYNPFNELNHLRPGKRYGFINRLENKAGFSPPFESPAVNLPHPWTRSVNGVCELATPESLRARHISDHFGPFEDHLVGCEMNGRSLIRMSLQQVDGNYQGAAYLMSRPPAEAKHTFEGPIVCEVSPAGDILVGNLHDSGWGGGQNTGSLVRLRPQGDWPLGIAEVRATPDGFEIDFTGPVDRQLAERPESYAIRSYRRVSTPAYGGDDQDESIERVQAVELRAGGRQVALKLAELKAGYVYELNLDALSAAEGAREFFPTQAHYTMRAVPKRTE